MIQLFQMPFKVQVVVVLQFAEEALQFCSLVRDFFTKQLAEAHLPLLFAGEVIHADAD